METPYRYEREDILALEPLHFRTRTGILFNYIVFVLPRVKKLLHYWEREAARCADSELKKQALASLHEKAFHCQGGAVYAVNCRHNQDTVLRLIVAYQTICDYLDNLCDRAGSNDEKAFAELHQALFDALTPDAPKADYYSCCPYRDDGGYLGKLVEECRCCIVRLPGYSAVHADIMELARLYADLQVKKHIAPERREQVLRDWAQANMTPYPGLQWQEFAAATGSTLAIFALFVLAAHGTVGGKQQQIMQAYFPWICGLHILLDYYIDQEEDRQGGDLNFTFYYAGLDEMMERLQTFIRKSNACADSLPSAVFDGTVVKGLLAMYLSDRKVSEQGRDEQARLLIKESGPGTQGVLNLCRWVRKVLLVN